MGDAGADKHCGIDRSYQETHADATSLKSYSRSDLCRTLKVRFLASRPAARGSNSVTERNIAWSNRDQDKSGAVDRSACYRTRRVELGPNKICHLVCHSKLNVSESAPSQVVRTLSMLEKVGKLILSHLVSMESIRKQICSMALPNPPPHQLD